MKVSIGEATFHIAFDTREWSLFDDSNPFTRQGAKFARYIIDAPDKSIVSRKYTGHSYNRNAHGIVICANHFISEMESSRDLLEYDYSYYFAGNDAMTRGGGNLSGFKVDGRSASVWRSRGGAFLTVKVSEQGPNGLGRTVQYLDLRSLKRLQTDRGELRIKRRRVEFDTPSKIESLVGFIRSNIDFDGNLNAEIRIHREVSDC